MARVWHAEPLLLAPRRLLLGPAANSRRRQPSQEAEEPVLQRTNLWAWQAFCKLGHRAARMLCKQHRASGRVAIGAAFNDGGDTNAGSVRIYAWNSTGWEQLGGDIDGESSYDYSGAGASVSLSANGIRVAIGAAANAGGSFKAGHVRVHALDDDSGDWAQLGADIDGADVYEQFGIAVSLSADGAALAVGSSSTSGAGHVRVYAWSSTAWVQLGTDIDGEADGEDEVDDGHLSVVRGRQ